MTPVELMALAGCGRPEGGRGCDVCVAAAEVHIQAIGVAGLSVVPTKDLLLTVAIAMAAVEMTTQNPEAREMFARLLAALPERTDHA